VYHPFVIRVCIVSHQTHRDRLEMLQQDLPGQ